MDSGRLHGLVGGARAGERGPFDAVDPDNALGLYFDDVDGHSASPSASPPPLAFQHAIPISDLELADAWDRFRDPVGELDLPSGGAPPLSDGFTLLSPLSGDLSALDLRLVTFDDVQPAANRPTAHAILSPLLFPRHFPGAPPGLPRTNVDAFVPPLKVARADNWPYLSCPWSCGWYCNPSNRYCVPLEEWYDHIITCRGLENVKIFECDCGRRFPRIQALIRHNSHPLMHGRRYAPSYSYADLAAVSLCQGG
ncbi:hypothetical protein FA95DRAFT_1565193, partial [Auriscalpium vulgare]